MERTSTDILIAGGGVAGLTAAAAFGTAGFRVVIVDPTPPITTDDAAGSDLRTTAFLQPAQQFLEAAGLWQSLWRRGYAHHRHYRPSAPLDR